MGQIAAQCVIDQIEGIAEYVPEIAIEPELVIRASSGPAPSPFGQPGTVHSDRQAHR
jgi:LacI family transcriptional regulator